MVRGTAYGRFAPRSDGARYPEGPRLQADLASIAAGGLNTIRTFDVPPADLLSAAADMGLRVLVGLDYPDWRFEPFPDRSSGHRIAAAGLAAVDRLFERVDDPDVLLAVSVGRNLPADLVRVHHTEAVAETLSSIVGRIHELEPTVLATYTGRDDANALMTVDGCDLLSIVLGAECGKTFDRNLHRLQQAMPARPIVVTDLEPPLTGETAVVQAQDLADRLNALDRAGCAGATVATWVDEPLATEGPTTLRPASLATTDRALKPLGRCVEIWARQNVKDLRHTWPRVTALVRAHNSESTIERCLSALELSDYHDLEVIVCDEGSTDRTLALASRFPFEVLHPERSDDTSRPNGLEAASGDIVAFLDADAVCHPLWPWFLALAFDSTDRVAVVTDHLVGIDADADHSSVALAAAALADLGRLPDVDPAAALVAGVDGLAVRRSAIGTARFGTGSAVAAGEHLIRQLGSHPNDSIGTAPAAQVVRPAPDHLGAVWCDAARRGRLDRQAIEPSLTAKEGPRRIVAELLASMLTGERPPRPVALRAVLDQVVPLLTVAAVLGAAIVVAGATVAGLVIAGTAVLLAAVPASVVAHDVVHHVANNAAAEGRGRKRAAIGLAVAVVILLEPLARVWGRLRTHPRPLPPANRSWTGDRDHLLSELRWRLGLAHLSVFTPANRRRWDIEVRCGWF
ncbi:MAG: glycosyltransferase family 2 protein, partial [Acidimicrobiia bacterium]|nr:glycosyltransferase family 2 protein [Acidimicrobiia bacterium]